MEDLRNAFARALLSAHRPNGHFYRPDCIYSMRPAGEILLRQRGGYSCVRCAPRETAMGKQGAERRKTVCKARI